MGIGQRRGGIGGVETHGPARLQRRAARRRRDRRQKGDEPFFGLADPVAIDVEPRIAGVDHDGHRIAIGNARKRRPCSRHVGGGLREDLGDPFGAKRLGRGVVGDRQAQQREADGLVRQSVPIAGLQRPFDPAQKAHAAKGKAIRGRGHRDGGQIGLGRGQTAAGKLIGQGLRGAG